nr:unnamed protein product [Callosobruchus analis]
MKVHWRSLIVFGITFWVDKEELSILDKGIYKNLDNVKQFIKETQFGQRLYNFGWTLLLWNTVTFIFCLSFCFCAKTLSWVLWKMFMPGRSGQQILQMATFSTMPQRSNSSLSKIPVKVRQLCGRSSDTNINIKPKIGQDASCPNLLTKKLNRGSSTANSQVFYDSMETVPLKPQCQTIYKNDRIFPDNESERKFDKHLENQCEKLREEMVKLQANSLKEHAVLSRKLEAVTKEKKDMAKLLATLTYEEMSTLLAQIEAILNSRPLIPLSPDPSDCDVLTPAHFLIGRRLISVPDPNLIDIKTTRLSRFQLIQQHNQVFWKRWSAEYLHELQERTKWKQWQQQLKLGTLVLLRDDQAPPLCWRLGRVQALHPGPDGVARVASIRTPQGIAALVKRLENATKEFKNNTKTKKFALQKLDEATANAENLKKQLEQVTRDKEILEGKLRLLEKEYEKLQERVIMSSKTNLDNYHERTCMPERDSSDKRADQAMGHLEVCQVKRKLGNSITTEIDMKKIQVKIKQLERNLENFNSSSPTGLQNVEAESEISLSAQGNATDTGRTEEETDVSDFFGSSPRFRYWGGRAGDMNFLKSLHNENKSHTSHSVVYDTF